MRPKPDNRNDNVENIAYNIRKTEENIKRANDMKNTISDKKMKEELEDKNKRREDAIESMRVELRDEIEDRNNQYR